MQLTLFNIMIAIITNRNNKMLIKFSFQPGYVYRFRGGKSESKKERAMEKPSATGGFITFGSAIFGRNYTFAEIIQCTQLYRRTEILSKNDFIFKRTSRLWK